MGYMQKSFLLEQEKALPWYGTKQLGFGALLPGSGVIGKSFEEQNFFN